jgi:peptide chain release factor 1
MAWPQTVRKSDLRIDYYRGSGAGGQHRNKTDSACRMTHLPTGITSQCEDHKKQPQNRKEAFRRLAAKLVPIMKDLARGVQPKGRSVSDRVRSYNEPKQRVTDHRTGKKYSYTSVLNSDALDDIIEDNIVGEI